MNKHILVPTKAHIIFDQSQAYAAYSLPKIQYKPHDFTNDKQETMQIVRKQLDEVEEVPRKGLQKVQSAFPTRSEPRLKEWNVNYLEDIGYGEG